MIMRAPEFWNESGLTARLAAHALAPIGWLYGASVAWKARHATPYRATARVICAGNLTAGGTGKTPVAIAIAQSLQKAGRNPVFLSRGYGGRLSGPDLVDPAKHRATDVGDEPLLLAKTAPVIVAHDRAAGAKFAESAGFDTIIMDDGHQNFALAKDLSLVVVDAKAGFGNGYILPAGPLREAAPQGLSRADAVILVGEGSPPLAGYSGPVLRVHIRPIQEGNLAGQRAVAFAGIGQPEKFFRTLRAEGVELVATYSYADHHAYTAAEITWLKSKAHDAGALLTTTEKDYVRLTAADRKGITTLAIQAQFDSEDAFTEVLSKATSGEVHR
jgi:tetraacyldisaccharide 4'-kinase